MKINIVLALILGFLLVACKSDDSNPSGSGNNNGNSTMTAKVNGSDWSASGLLIGQKVGTQIGITGDQLTGGRDKKIQINLMGISGPGTFSLGTFMGVYIDIPQGTTDPQVVLAATEMASSGSVTVTELSDSKIKGTFSMTTDEGTQITNGSFDVKF